MSTKQQVSIITELV